MFQGAAETQSRREGPARDSHAASGSAHFGCRGHCSDGAPRWLPAALPRPPSRRSAPALHPSPAFNEQARWWQRLLVGFAEELELDAQGRILVSPALRKFAGLKKNVMLVGQGSHFELWDVEVWESASSPRRWPRRARPRRPARKTFRCRAPSAPQPVLLQKPSMRSPWMKPGERRLRGRDVRARRARAADSRVGSGRQAG